MNIFKKHHVPPSSDLHVTILSSCDHSTLEVTSRAFTVPTDPPGTPPSCAVLLETVWEPTWDMVFVLIHPVTTLDVYQLYCMELTPAEIVAVKDTLHWPTFFSFSSLPCSQKRPCVLATEM